MPAGVSAIGLKAEGFSLAEIRAAGYPMKELKLAGFSPQEMHDAGFAAHELTAAHADGTPRPRGLKALDVGSPHITDAAISDLCALAHAGLDTLTLWHTKVSRVALERLMHATGLALDTSMGTSDGTYLLRRWSFGYDIPA